MWNAFDTSFLIITFAYLVLRVRGLITQDGVYQFLRYKPRCTKDPCKDRISDMAFDVLACGACVLFPRYANKSVRDS